MSISFMIFLSALHSSILSDKVIKCSDNFIYSPLKNIYINQTNTPINSLGNYVK